MEKSYLSSLLRERRSSAMRSRLWVRVSVERERVRFRRFRKDLDMGFGSRWDIVKVYASDGNQL